MRFLQASCRAIRWATVATALSLVSPVAYAQQPSAAAVATAKEIVAFTGATALFDPLIRRIIEQSKILFLQQNPALAKDLNEIAAKLKTELTPRFSELVNEVANNYARRFSEQELKDVLAFYKSPVGGKLLREQPQIVDTSLKFAQTWANTLSDQVIAKMRDQLKKKGYAL